MANADAPEVVVSLDGVEKFLGGRRVLRSLSLKVHQGEILGLLGPSGCGKTTTLRIIAGLEVPDGGTVHFGSRPIVSPKDRIFVPPHKRNVGLVFQNYALWPHMTVAENVGYPLRVRHVAKAEKQERVGQALERVGLAGFQDRHVTQLSGGEQQRVAVARALIYEPSVLLLDEPFSNLDAKLRDQLRVSMRSMLKRLDKTGVVLVTHDQTEALSLSDRVAVMDQGVIHQLSSPRELYDRPTTPFVRDFVGRSVAFEGIVTSVASPTEVVVELTGTASEQVIGRSSSETPPSAGDAVRAYVRPEHLQIVKSADGARNANQVGVVVETVVFSGDRLECQVRLPNGEQVLVFAPRSAELVEGAGAVLDVERQGVVVWPA